MSRKHFSWLLILSVLVALVALLLPGRTGNEQPADNSRLVPGLEEQVNDIAWLRIHAAGGTVLATFVRHDRQWVVEEAHGYRADWESLRSLLSGLASARILEAKTTNPAYYDRLGVEEVSAADAGGYLVEFDAQSGLPAVIIGKRAQGRKGQYARLQDAGQSVLVDQQFDLASERRAWLDQQIIDIGEAEVVEIGITHPDGEKILARKASADDRNFELVGIPDGFELKSDWTVNSLAGNLAVLNLEEVAPADEIDWAGATMFRLLTADGLDAEVSLVSTPGDEESDPEYWLRLQSGVYTTAVGSGVDEEQDSDATAERAVQINERVDGWAYRVPRYKYDAMVKRMDDLVQKTEPDA